MIEVAEPVVAVPGAVALVQLGAAIVTPGEVAVAVFAPVPVTASVQAAPAADGGVNVALQAFDAALNPATVDVPEHPPPQTAVNVVGAATV